jgi:hypothetical protein
MGDTGGWELLSQSQYEPGDAAGGCSSVLVVSASVARLAEHDARGVGGRNQGHGSFT